MMIRSIILLIVVLTTWACAKEKEQQPTQLIMLVDSKYVSTPSNIYPNKSLKIKIEGETNWSTLYNNWIDGFEYEEGFTYKLIVQKKSILNPAQDASSHSYTLIKIIEKVPVQNVQ